MGIEPEIGKDPFEVLENMEPLTESFDISESQPVLEEVFIHAIQVLNQLLILNIV
jgi:hypothetical protein